MDQNLKPTSTKPALPLAAIPYTFNFFGPATKDVNDVINPEYIGGSFRESFPNGAVSGAFAAKRDEPG